MFPNAVQHMPCLNGQFQVSNSSHPWDQHHCMWQRENLMGWRELLTWIFEADTSGCSLRKQGLQLWLTWESTRTVGDRRSQMPWHHHLLNLLFHVNKTREAENFGNNANPHNKNQYFLNLLFHVNNLWKLKILGEQWHS